MQEYFTERQERSDLVMTLAGTRSVSNTDVEGSSDGGSKINSKETSRYDLKSSSEMYQDQVTNGYSDSYTIGHTETSSKENSQTDTISNTLSNTWTKEHGWSQEESKSNTVSNGRTFGKSASNTNTKEVSVEDSKTISKDNTISKVNSKSITYSVNQQLTNNPSNDGCYEYEVTPRLKSEAIVWACGVNDNYDGDHVEFYTTEISHNDGDNFIINKTGCSSREKSEFGIFDNNLYNLIMASGNEVGNFMITGDELIAPTFDISGTDYSKSMISTNNPKNRWYFGILPSGRLALCKNTFDEKHMFWYTETAIPNTDDLNASKIDLKFKISENGHLVMTAKNILKEYDIKDDDLYKVDISQEIVIWNSLPKDLPFTVGYRGTRGYTLMIVEKSKSDCKIILYDGLFSQIWKISSNTGTSYQGYSFLLEYNLPLKFKTKRSNKFDKHNYISNSVSNNKKYPSELDFKCDFKINEEEAIVSDNGVYKAYLQPSGNLVIKEYERTLWSTNTANVGPFSSPYTLSFSPIGEMIIRDKQITTTSKYITTSTKSTTSISSTTTTLIKTNTITKTTETNLSKPTSNIENLVIPKTDDHQYYKLKLTDNGELKIIDNNNNIIWSSLFVRQNNFHMRYVEPLVYSISSCNEKLRLPYIYNIHSYEQPNHENIKVDPYFNNLIPGERLVYEYDANVFLALNDTHLTWNTYGDESVVAECSKTKELKLLSSGLYLYCENNKITLTSLDDVGDNNEENIYTITIKKNVRNFDFKLIIMDMKTHDVIRGYNPVKFLNSLEEREHKYMGKIDISNTLTMYDKLYSKEGDGKYVYLSNDFGLRLFGKGAFVEIYELKIKNNRFIMNNNIIVNNIPNMKLEYYSKPNALVLSNNTDIIWKYPGYLDCNVLSSSNDECRDIYSLSPIYEKDGKIPWLQLSTQGMLYRRYGMPLLDINSYLNTNEIIYSINLTKDGDILVNNNLSLHREYYKPENSYSLELINNDLTLVLKSSRGEYKWCNNYIFNRPLYSSTIHIGDSFQEGEMLYCNSYSLIILDGKLLYRNHINITEEVVFEIPNIRITSLSITDRNIVLLSDKKVQYVLTENLAKSNTNSFLSCGFPDNSVYWDDGNGKVLWKYSINNSSNSKSDAIWLYNRYYNKCLYAELNEMITYEDCKNKDKYKWYYENIDGDTYFKSAYKENLCMRVNKNRIVLGNCDNNAVMKYIKTSKFIKRNDKCVSGIDDNDDLDSQFYVKLNNCDRHNKKQLWEFISDINDISN
ncbi:hypothetical protein H8356DRAFT_918592 [Neocallimastix lanati (nom. inval.)]|nr:hypothetical protein H8356DRAFT_918592 [Neocallimastix sp. JGI-2020a]